MYINNVLLSVVLLFFPKSYFISILCQIALVTVIPISQYMEPNHTQRWGNEVDKWGRWGKDEDEE